VIERAEQLREVREAAGLTLLDVAQRLRLSARHLQAIEAADWQSLPGVAFSRAALRSYARLLGVQVESLLAQLPSANAPDLLRPAPSLETRLPRRGDGLGFRTATSGGLRRWVWAGCALLAVFIACALVIWPDAIRGLRESVKARQEPGGSAAVSAGMDRSVGQDRPTSDTDPSAAPGLAPGPSEGRPMASAGSAPEGVPRATVPLEAGGSVIRGETDLQIRTPSIDPAARMIWPQPLVVSAVQDSWVEVRDQGNRVLYMGLVRPSTALTLQLKGPVSYTVGNSANTVMQFEGRTVNLAAQTQPGTNIAKGSLP